MENQNNQPNIAGDSNIDLNSELLKNSTVFKNINQQFVVTTADKLELVLIKTRHAFQAERNWLTPLGLVISFATTLCTTDFKTNLLTSQEWKALFVFGTIASSIWLLYSLYELCKNWGETDLVKVIEQIKANPQKNTPPNI